MKRKNILILLQILTILLFIWCCFFKVTRDMPSGGGVPGLSGLEAALFVFPYMFALFLNSINIILVFIKKRGFPIFSLIASTIFFLVIYWLTNDWNYDIDESLSMYLLGPLVLVLVNIFVLFIRQEIKRTKLNTRS
jgi:hypothetical protein